MIPYQVQLHDIGEVKSGPPEAARTFRVPQCPFWIECSCTALDQIRREVENAVKSRRDGRETGGVLFGRIELGLIHIAAHRPLPCDHAMGPGFVLSPGDEERLLELIAVSRTDPDLTSLQPVGWYHSHIASRIYLSGRDRQIHMRYFGAPLQVALVLRPSPERATRAGFFFRESTGAMRTDSSYEEFVIESTPPVREIRKPFVAEAPGERSHSANVSAGPEEPVCPKCGSRHIRRSQRMHLVERLRGALGYYPYRCQECLSRSFIRRSVDLMDLLRPNSGKRPEERRRAWLRTRREFLLWGAGIAGFLLILLYMVRDAGPKPDQP
jgi:proteasome lid subunit RPN8/RPN11